MEFIDAVQKMLPHLTGGLKITISEHAEHNEQENQDNLTLEQFEKKYCLIKTVQVLYTKAGLLAFFEQKNDKHIYQITEPLDTHLAALKIGTKWILIGPFVTEEWSGSRARTLLAQQGAKEESLQSYRNYRCSLPILPEEYAVRVAVLLLVNTVGNPPRELERIDMEVQKAEQLPPKISNEYENTSQVIHRYELEDMFIEEITKGHTSKAIETLSEFQKSTQSISFVDNRLLDGQIGVMAMRTMVRRAALTAGLTPIVVDAISQQYAQRMHSATSEKKLQELCNKYISEICQAIRQHCKPQYSASVKKALQYIEMYLSQEINADALAEYCGVTRRHLTTLIRKETGKTIVQYITEARCAKAADLLENTQLLIQEISCYVGYEDTNYFARVFRNTYGLSPQDYRKKRKKY